MVCTEIVVFKSDKWSKECSLSKFLIQIFFLISYMPQTGGIFSNKSLVTVAL